MMQNQIRLTFACLALLHAGTAGTAAAQSSPPPRTQEITRAGTQASAAGPSDYFTGRARIDPVWPADEHINASGGLVTFEPGARSAWHTHPAGQRLVVVSGVGLTQEWGKKVQVIRPGDVIACPPGVKHWHGASPDKAMTHLALTGTVNNKAVEWMEKVTDAQYNAGARPVNTTHALSAKQRGIIPIAAFTATGDQERLRTALTEGLEAGLTVNEIKEILVQMYAYAGFPRSLSGIQTFMAVTDERQARGIKDQAGRDASPLPAGMNRDEYGAKVRATLVGQKVIPAPSGYQLFTPVIDTFLKEHLFADIFARDVLDHQSRELATIAALSSMTGTRSQLQFHLGAAMNVGLTEAQMRDFVTVLAAKVGERESESAGEVLTAVLHGRK
jgi:quercetin dioxygenase-like cupin family protein